MVDINSIKRNPQNYRRHPLSQIDRIASSLSRFGQRKPLIVRRKNGELELIAGEGTLEAMHFLVKRDVAKWSAAWVTLVPEWFTDEDCLGLLVADNETTRGADANNELLADILDRQQLAGHELASLGFSSDDYNELLASIEKNVPVASTVEPLQDNRLNEFNFGETRQLVLNFTVAEYAAIIERLARIRESQGLENNTDVFTMLLDAYENQGAKAQSPLNDGR
jgi:hypothetical protein